MDSRAAIWVIACGIGLLAFITAPDIRPFGAQMVAPASIVYFPGDRVGQPVPVAEGQAQLRRDAKDAGPPVMRQLHFALPTSKGAALYMPAAPGDAALWVNGMVGGDAAQGSYFGPGFGPHRMALEIPASQLSFENNRLDMVSLQGWGQGQGAARKPLILAIPARSGPAFAAMMDQVEARLRHGALAFGGLGLLLSLIGLLMLRSRALYVGGALFSAALLDQGLGLLPVWLRLAVAVAGLAVLFARRGWRQPVTGGAMIAAVVAVVAGGALLSGLGGSLVLSWGANAALWPLAGFAMPYLAFGEGRLVWADFVAARAKIREQAAVIEQQADALQGSIRTAAVAEERQRFVRDMHDGVGGHLLSLLMRVRADDADSKDVAEELEKGLTDLRLMADSLDHVGADLDAALAAFHRRAGQQLASAGLEFDWSKPQELSGFAMDARAVLSLYRIIQEALSNCIRHAGATRFGVSFDLADGGARLDVVIEDDGVGFGVVEEGRGLGNIRKRAEKLGGTVEFGSGDEGKGCRIRLSLPGG
jgi:signal transduction histidine kinase